MNDDPSASSSTDPARTGPNLDAQSSTDVERHNRRNDQQVRQRNWRTAQNKKRAEFMDDLLRNFDILIYTQLSVIYYMEYGPGT
jgi:hypothetical protein